jgi:hypothetical protein
MSCRLPLVVWVLALAPLSCRSLLGLDVTYEDCLPAGNADYIEEFHDPGHLEDYCWRTDHTGDAGANAMIWVHEDGDLVVYSGDTGEWTADSQAPMAYRHIEGDFVFAARAEASDRLSAAHCNPEAKFAGIIVRSDPENWTSLLVRPFLASPEMGCEDEPLLEPPVARAEVRGSGFGSTVAPPAAELSIDAIGDDGEAHVAVCRIGGELLYYFFDADRDTWPEVQRDFRRDVGDGPLDVGVTVSGRAPDFAVEGHFDAVAFIQEVAGDNCAGTLEKLRLPEDD